MDWIEDTYQKNEKKNTVRAKVNGNVVPNYLVLKGTSLTHEHFYSQPIFTLISIDG